MIDPSSRTTDVLSETSSLLRLAHVAHAYTPRETGSHGGSDHIITEVEIVAGRLRRWPGDALCKQGHKFWGLQPVEANREATCKRCLALAARPDVAAAIR